MNDTWLNIAADICHHREDYEDPQERYYWILSGVINDIKEMLELAPIEQLQHDLEKSGIYFGIKE